jgi:hypothetical protein
MEEAGVYLMGMLRMAMDLMSYRRGIPGALEVLPFLYT